MPTTTVSKHYNQDSVSLNVEGEALVKSGTTAELTEITQALTSTLTIRQDPSTHDIAGDPAILKDLSTVLDRYLGFILTGQSQGTFSGTVALRPLDFAYHRLTVRQGEGIAQVDLATTELYDLAEVIADMTDDLPQLTEIKTKRPPSWYSQPTGVAAILVGGIGVAAAVIALGGTLSTRDTEETVAVVSTPAQVDQLSAPGAPPNPDEDTADTDEQASQRSSAATVGEAESLAANSVDTLDEDSLAAQLQGSLTQDWTAPDDLDVALAYSVAVDAAGEVVSVDPVDPISEERQAETPLGVPEQPSELGAVGDSTTLFAVTFTPDGEVEVTLAN